MPLAHGSKVAGRRVLGVAGRARNEPKFAIKGHSSTISTERWVRMAEDREQSRQSLYREAKQVVAAVDGAAAHTRIAALEQQVSQLQSLVQQLQARRERSVEMTPEKQAEMACVAQAEGVSLAVARRLLQAMMTPQSPSVPTLGRATLEAGERAGALLQATPQNQFDKGFSIPGKTG
jgi:hypothetical protein